MQLITSNTGKKSKVGRKPHQNKALCHQVLADIVPHLPSKYTKIIQESLAKKGIVVSIRQINSTRSGKTFHLDIIAEMKYLAEIQKKKLAIISNN